MSKPGPFARHTARTGRPTRRGSAAVLAAALLALPSLPADAAQSGDVVVVAPNGRFGRAVVVVGPGNDLRCRVTRSTGDAATDARGCAGMRDCLAVAGPRLASLREVPAAAARKRLFGTIQRDLTACFAAVSDRFVDRLPAAAPPSTDE